MYQRGYKRPRKTYSKKKFVRKYRPYAGTKRRKLVSLIKRTVLKKSEPKEKRILNAKTNVYHNCFYNASGVSSGLLIQLNSSNSMPGQGVGDGQRVGDEIYMSMFKIKMLLGQQADRPNVNWRYIAFRVPKGSSITYSSWFKATTSNIMLDDPNVDFVKVLKAGVWRPNEAGLAGGGSDEYTFVKTVVIPYKRLIKFGPGDAVSTHNDDDIYLWIGGYDAFGTLPTDIVGYIEAQHTIYYRDP